MQDAEKFNRTEKIHLNFLNGLLPQKKVLGVSVWAPPSPSPAKVLPEPVPQHDSLYQELLQSVYDAVLVTQMTGEIIDVNGRAIDFLSYEREELCGLRISNIIVGADEALLSTIHENLAKQRFTLIEGYGVRKDGSTFPCEIVVNIIHLTKKGQFCFFVRDITERKRAEDMLRTHHNAVHNSGSGIAMVDLEARLEYVNPAFLKMWGFDDGSEVVGRILGDFWRDQNVGDEIIQSALRENVWEGEIVGVKKDGNDFHVQISAAGNRDPEGRLLGMVFSFTDITEKKLTQEAMLHAQKLESIGVLAGGIAHDFNNLLGIVMGNAELALQDLSKKSAGHTFVRQIKVACQRGADLCRQMLAYAGKGRFTMSSLDLNGVVREISELLRISLSKSAVLNYKLSAQLPPVKGDATQIGQVLVNLITNASDAIGKKDGSITVGTGVMHLDQERLKRMYCGKNLPEDDYVYVEVTDTGCGMNSEMLSKIFDPFYTTKFTGRGLGLAAVFGIMHGHSGALEVISEMGVGSTFRLILPRLDHSIAQLPVKNATDSNWQGKGTVLIVDDEENLRDVVTAMMKMLGFNVLLANDGNEGIRVYTQNQQQIDLVLLDLTMPHKSGQEVFLEIRQMNSKARILFMSGYNEQDVSVHCKGSAGFIHKPFDLNELRDKVRIATLKSANH